MHEQRIMIVDDETTLRTALFRALDKKGYQVITASTRQESMTLGQSGKGLDLALVDLRLPDGDGIELMMSLKQLHPNIKVIILTGFGTIENAIEATQKGAYHFVTKPFNLDEVLNLIDKALLQKKLESENSHLRNALHRRYRFDNIIGQSEPIQKVLEVIERVADSDSTVLITGESGTGKELVAKAIHYNSNRAQHPFIPVNCGAIPGELLESELFGHVKGAFTGAIANRVGRFELAEEGTIFFDEIGDMSPQLQIKLLRVLQERCFEPVGGTKTISSNVRVIAATNVNLEQAVMDGRFREDLYYRLNVIPMNIPALRERKSDIPLLLHYFLEQFNKNKKDKLSGFSAEATDQLMNYMWPGNIRELENLIERLSILKGSGLIDATDLPPRYQQAHMLPTVNSSRGIDIPDSGVDFNSAVDSYENALILQALQKTNWNRNQAALLLKLNRTTLVEKIKKKGLTPPAEA